MTNFSRLLKLMMMLVMMQTTFSWRYLEAPEPASSILVFFVRRQDHKEALEGNGEVFKGRGKPARLRLPPNTNEVHWHWGKYCQDQLSGISKEDQLNGFMRGGCLNWFSIKTS